MKVVVEFVIQEIGGAEGDRWRYRRLFYVVPLQTLLKETTFSLYGLGGLPSLLPINSPDIIAHIKGLSYLSDYMVIRATLGGPFKG